MSFMDNLANNPSGSGSIYGQPGPPDYDRILGVVNRLKDREMKDFQDKSNFMSDLTLKQDRLKAVFDTQQRMNQRAEMQQFSGEQGQQGQQGMNVVLGQDPNQMNEYQKGQLGMRQKELNLDSQKLAQQGKLGQERIDIQDATQKLGQQKSDQINIQKKAELEQDIKESNRKLEYSMQALQDKNLAADARLKLQEDIAKLAEERHNLDREQRDAQFKTTNENHLATIEQQRKQLEQNADTEQTIEYNPDGTRKSVATKKGASARRVEVKDSNGKVIGTVPEDKLDDWNKNHAGRY